MKINVAAAVFLIISQVHHALGAPATTKAFILTITNAQLAPDGFKRSTVVANGVFPGPLLTANKGDTLQVSVINHLTDQSMRRSTSINFDGLFVSTRNAASEGTPFVTTCPIGPDAVFTHVLPLGTQTGTFWYHSQLSAQYADGLRGPLIIYDHADPLSPLYDIDDADTIWQVGDWWHSSSVSLLAGYLETGIAPAAISGTFNGVGRFLDGPAVPFFVQSVQAGRRYRFRIINISAFSSFSLSVDQHNLTVIEADGAETQPLVVNELEILAGQRYSVVLQANQPVANYWINAPYFGGCVSNESMALSRAILRYMGAQISDPVGPMTLGPDNPNLLVEANLRPLVNVELPAPDINITIGLAFANAFRWIVNGVPYAPPTTPTLVKILQGEGGVAADYNATENTFLLPANKTIQIEFSPTDDEGDHPFHLHGNNFWVIKSDSSDLVNTAAPILRDVVGVGQNGTIIRFTTDNPGPWYFHCHILWHMEAGLATVLAAGVNETRTLAVVPAGWANLCPTYDALPPQLQ